MQLDYDNTTKELMVRILRERDLVSCIKLSETAPDDFVKGLAEYYAGEICYHAGDDTGFYIHTTSALPCLVKTKNYELLSSADLMMGTFFNNRGSIPFAMDYYMKAHDACSKNSKSTKKWLVAQRIGETYYKVQMFSEAVSWFERAKTDAPDTVLAKVSAKLGKALLKNNELEDAHAIAQTILNSPAIENNIPALCFGILLTINQSDGRVADYLNQLKKSMTHMHADDLNEVLEVMDVLLTSPYEEEFEHLLAKAEAYARNQNVLVYQKDVANLKVRYYQKKNQFQALAVAAVSYFTLSERVEQENTLSVVNALKEKTSLNYLSKVTNKLQEKSNTDALTRLHNRFKLSEDGARLFREAYNRRLPVAVEILDIDYFKQFNDNYGHQKGDGCLKMVAENIRSITSKDVRAYRYGGDEFVITYFGLSKAEVAKLTEELKAKFTDKKMTHEFSKCVPWVTISQGVCHGIPENENAFDSFLKTADNMLYEVKLESRNSIRVGNYKKGV